MARRGVARKKLVLVGCTCGFFIYLLLARRLVPRLSSPLVSLVGHESNQLDNQLDTLSNTRREVSENRLLQQQQQQQQQQHVQQIGENRHSEEQEEDNVNVQNHQQQQEQHQNDHLLFQQRQNQKKQQQDYHRVSQHQLHLNERQQQTHELLGQQKQHLNDVRQSHHMQQQQYQKEQQEDHDALPQQHKEQQQQQQLKQPQQLSRHAMQATDTLRHRVTQERDVLTNPQLAHSTKDVQQMDLRRKDSDIIWVNKVMRQKSDINQQTDNMKLTGTETNALPATGGTQSNGSRLVVVSDGYVRNCLTGDVIGRQPTTVSKGPLKVRDDESPEDTKSRVQSFQKVFDTRAWGHSWDQAYRGVNASGRSTT